MKVAYSFTDYEIAEILRVAFSSKFEVDGIEEMFSDRIEELKNNVLSLDELADELVKIMVEYTMNRFDSNETVKCHRCDDDVHSFQISRNIMNDVLNENGEVMELAYYVFEDEECQMYDKEYENKLLKIFCTIVENE